jgi:ribosomal protein S18 acetylase RimI-like enzyme
MADAIRSGTRSDVSQLRAIELAAGKLFPAERIPDAQQSYPEAALTQAADQGLLFVVEVSGELVGFAVCIVIGDRLHLEEVSVHPAHGRQGYGRALVARVIEAARKRNLAAVSLTTFADIAWNGPFYASMGFQPVPEAELDESLANTLAHELELGMTERIAMICQISREGAQL